LETYRWSSYPLYLRAPSRRPPEKVSVNGIDIFLLEAQDAAWLASYEWNIRARFITS